MAKPIQPTPTLEGEDAEALIKELLHPTTNKEHEAFLSKCREAYKITQR